MSKIGELEERKLSLDNQIFFAQAEKERIDFEIEILQRQISNKFNVDEDVYFYASPTEYIDCEYGSFRINAPILHMGKIAKVNRSRYGVIYYHIKSHEDPTVISISPIDEPYIFKNLEDGLSFVSGLIEKGRQSILEFASKVQARLSSTISVEPFDGEDEDE